MINSIKTTLIAVGFLLTHADFTAAESETVILIVHGTYDGVGAWVNVVSGKTSFASELQRGYGGNCEVVPFLWRSSVNHEVRVTAAQRLARQFDDDRYKRAKIVVVAHSHGGNVVLEAIGRCQRRIDTVVCLSTPHIFLNMKNADDKQLRLPVYCRPIARRRIRRLITVTPITDPVPRVCAELRLGLDEQIAIEWTTDWRRLTNNPRLADDGGPLTELVEDILDTKLTSNLTITPHLNIADANVDLASEVTGMRSHDRIHCRRFGYLLGQSLKSDEFQRIESDLAGVVLAKDADDGEPIDPGVHEAWLERHGPNLRHSGWILRELTITGTKKTRPPTKPGLPLRYWDADKSWPDLRFELQDRTAKRQLYLSSFLIDRESITWTLRIHLRRDVPLGLTVFDSDLPFSTADTIETLDLDPAEPARARWNSPRSSGVATFVPAHF